MSSPSLAHASLARSLRRLHFPSEAGAAIVEFALVLPILFIFLFGMIEFGRAINYWLDANHLANEAARWAVVNKNPGSATGQTLQKYIQQQADSDELKNGGSSSVAQPAVVCISFPNGTEKIGDPVQVTMAAEFTWMPFLAEKTSILATLLVGSSVMRLEALRTNYEPGSGGTGTC